MFQLLDCLLTPGLMLMAVFSLVCSALPANSFANVSYSVEEDGALISWDYWGPEKNIFVEYKNSKNIGLP